MSQKNNDLGAFLRNSKMCLHLHSWCDIFNPSSVIKIFFHIAEAEFK